ncbi:type II toxin-antitoxin system VapC family toxin [Candidatus Acetothermia bacterium]|jgi:PIN domain nuclease of toxin-antitoxin system|nr:type II toxin-antitoxin system VapC family toxin [Candidatus Acetothermia bacterium]
MPFVTDTHSLVWHVTGDPKLSARAKGVFRKVDNFEDYIFIPCIVFFELLYLVEKKRIAVDFDNFLAMVSSSKNYRIEPLCLPIIEKSRGIPRERVADPWDRLIAATSQYLNFPLITRDETLRETGLEVIW